MPKVLIIGAGWSGIYALKHCLEEGLDATILEARDHPLGVWHYSRLPGGVLRNTHATSSVPFTQPSDYPFPDDTPLFPHHDLIEKHMKNYIKHFNLEKHIKYKQKVTKVEKQGDKWVVTANNKKHPYDFVIVATGLNSVPKIPHDSVYKKFTGKKFHSHFFDKKHKKELAGKNVLIVGGGETSCDIAQILCDDSKVFLSIRNGQWFQDRITGAYQASDIGYSRVTHLNALTWKYATTVFKKEMEFWWGKGGSGVEIWKPTTGYFNGFYNKSRDIVQSIAQGQIFPRKGVRDIKGKQVSFYEPKGWDKIDVIMFGTGYDYKKGLSFLDKKIVETPKYKHIFYPNDPSIAFVGYLRPYLGSIPMLAELQSRYVAKVFTRKAEIPEDMNEVVEQEIEAQKKMFPKHMPFLVNPFNYSDEIASKINAKPRMWELLLTNPLLWWKVGTQPWTPFQYRIYDEDEKKRQIALNEIKKMEHNKTTIQLRGRMYRICASMTYLLVTTSLAVYAVYLLI